MDAADIVKDAKGRIVTSRRKMLAQWAQLCGDRAKAAAKTGFGAQIASNLVNMMRKYENADWQSQALDVVMESPVYRLVDVAISNDPALDYTDELVRQLLRWFKEDFFRWVNKLNCEACGNDDQDSIIALGARRAYSQDHFAGQANVVERYRCQKCSAEYEFPRYNNPARLLQTRKGRCGEWNNCFVLLLVSLGLDVRYVWNAEDHVWCEYFSANLKRWVHLDSCENSFDNPLLYNDGWGKRMSYTFAIHKYYILDVSKKYLDTTKPERHIPRNKVSDQDLTALLLSLNAARLTSISIDAEFLDITSKLVCDNHFSSGKITTLTDNPCRQSGAPSWTAKRGENGK